MRLLRIVLSAVLVAGLAGVATIAQKIEAPATKMTTAADKFLGTLDADQKTRAVIDFNDKERTNWHFIPLQDKAKKSTRRGMPLEDMKPEQKKAALDLLRTGVSGSGYEKAITIMSLEAILRDLEKEGAMVRNPEWYFFTIFGKPSAEGKWGWRVEGHHLSLNFVVDKGVVSSITPAFFGANPAIVKDGKKKGLRTLPDSEDLAIELFKSLDDDQKKAAYHEKEFPEPAQEKATPNVGKPVGLAAKKMTPKQRETLVKLLTAYTDRMPEPMGKEEMDAVRKAGIDDVHFAYNGATELGKKHSYRVQGPTFVVEFLNVQADASGNVANHIHSCWRHIEGDFGLSAKQ